MRQTLNELAALVAARVSDAAVYAYAEDHDCSTLTARSDLEAEAVAEITGRPVDYQQDYRTHAAATFAAGAL